MPEPKKQLVRETKPRLVSTQLSAEAYQKLKAAAEKEDRTVGYLIRRAILDALGLDSKAA
ncbi:MAG TPA: ribbon-helix-helix protein, CopG family [Candidatus Dormibacteraeota bacterium]|nr:ribbon-helix-helix protein, CopG family [Candidatus Dormibacteraeota bacterium]